MAEPKTESKPQRKSKLIALDLDDTIVGFLPGLIQLHNKKYGTCIASSDLKTWDFSGMEFTDARGNKVSGEELRKTFREYEADGLYVGLEPLPYATQALEIIQKLGYKIAILTARSNIFGKQTELNLLTRRIPHTEGLVFLKDDVNENTEEFKVRKLKEMSKKYKVVAFADDKMSTVEMVQDRCNIDKCFLIEQPHNKDIPLESEEILRVKDLLEIVRYLK